mmetsp:Transcript_36884/g.97997  ORF Transcript_36884/g.97997 Transcript_36884/m.97997 type:complete len:94 (-) Transcript_36884:2679-2960(-)
MRVFVALCTFALFNIASCVDPLVQGGFMDGDPAGWSLVHRNGLPTKFQIVSDSSGLSGTDTRLSLPWYFMAPLTFSGNFVNAYNGKIQVLFLD